MDVVKEFEKVAEAVAEEFCKKHEVEREGWVAGNIGDSLFIGDSVVSLNDMLLDLKENVPKDEYWEYDAYCMQAAFYGVTIPNYRSWLKGCPRLSEDDFAKLRDAMERRNKAEAAFNDLVKQYK